jgi:hypothetical protein
MNDKQSTSYRKTNPMKPISLVLLLAGLALAVPARAQVPQTLSYQGHVAVDGTNFTGAGAFKFALVNTAGNTTFWSNDGTSVGGNEPTAAANVNVNEGYYSLLLGDASLANMTPIPHSVFDNPNVRLRIWFDDGQNGFQQLAPDQAISAVAYAMMTANVPDGSITAPKLAPGAIGAAQLAPNSVNSGHIIDGEVKTADIANLAVTTGKLADNSVTSAKLANFIDLGDAANSGTLNIWNGFTGVRSIEMDAIGYRISTYGNDSLERTRLWGWNYGELWLRDNKDNTRTVYLTSGNDGSLAPQLDLLSSEGLDGANLSATREGGILTLYGVGGRSGDAGAGAVLYGNEGNGVGALSLRNQAGSPRARFYGGPSGRMYLYNDAGAERMRLLGGPSTASLSMFNNAGEQNIVLWSYDNEEGVVSVRNKFGNETVYLWGRNSQDSNGGQIGLKNSAGIETIRLNADHNGEGRITTQVLQITGGSDLSEQFDINTAEHTLEPGMVVSIDPQDPGKLRLSTRSYDPTVAGVVSGAGGVKPGMLMGQVGTAADGKHPVALTGRVYCQVDASYGAIRPGDLITTSDTPGHGMKVTNHTQARGAIIGKAMTKLDAGQGLVLVLVSLQ